MNISMTLTESITQVLLNEIRIGVYKDSKRLPPEKEIALNIGVSRTVVRDALAILEREGFINRKHGVGTIINRHVLSIANRMDLEQEFCEQVEASGHRAKRKLVKVEKIYADLELAQLLEIEINDSVLAVSCVIFADGIPAIFSTDYISTELIIDNTYTETEFEKPIFDFLLNYCEIDVHMDVTQVRAIPADITIAKHLDLPFATPVLYMSELGYTFFGKPVMYAKEYYVDGIMKHTLLRKKI